MNNDDFKIVSRHIYCTSDEKPALRVTRKESPQGQKTFFQEYFSNGKWVVGGAKQPITPLYYHKWKTKDSIVILVEGEKKADALMALGLDATATPGGAKSWKKTYAPFLADRTVFIIPDNDDPGRGYAQAAKRDLEKVCTKVRVVFLQCLEKSEDIIDWLNKGGKKDELLELFKAAEKEESEPSKDEDENDKKEKSQCDQLIQAAQTTPKFELFHDEYQDAFAKLPNTNKAGARTVPVRSRTFGLFLRYLFFKKTKSSPSRDVLEKVTGTLEAQAQFEGKQYKLSVRVAGSEGAYWYDLGECAVKIDSHGWTIVHDAPILFRQYPVQQSQVFPEKNGSLNQIFDYVNVTKENDKILLLTFLISSFIPDMPHPILTIIGPQGAAKTTLEKVILRLVDPSMTEDIPTNDMRELLQAVSHRWVVPFDNLSRIPKSISDLFCKLVTGGGFTKRILYSDDDDVIRKFRRVIILNGINMPVEKADILDRTIILELERIKGAVRLDERTLLSDFERELPRILGACFDVLSQAMVIYPTIKLLEKPRMADFAIWGCAIAEACGYTQDQFLDAYRKNIDRQTFEALDASSLATVLMLYLDERQSIEGTASGILEALRGKIDEAGVDEKYFPKTPRALGRQLQEITPNLEAVGYVVEKRRTDEKRWIKIQRPQNPKTNVSDVMPSNTNGQDDKSDIELGWQ